MVGKFAVNIVFSSNLYDASLITRVSGSSESSVIVKEIVATFDSSSPFVTLKVKESEPT